MQCGGVEKALIDLVSSLDKEKYDISVIVMSEGGSFYSEAKHKIPMKSIFSNFKLPKNRACQKIRSVIINFIEKNRYKYPRTYYQYAIGGKYDIEIAFSSFDSHIIIANSVNKKSKKIVWIHGNIATDEDMQRYFATSEVLVKCLDSFDKMVFVAETAKEGFEKTFKINVSSVVMRNVINTDDILEKSKVDLENTYHLSSDMKTICAVGRLSPEKGYERLVLIHASLLKKDIKHRLIIVGEGKCRENIEKIINERHLQDTVFLVGYDSNPYKYMRNSDFFVCSSYTEGLPIVCQEALALGIPIVSSFPSVGELFGDEPCGIISDVDDDSLMAAIEKMLTDEEFYNSCKKAAERRSKYFDTRVAVREIEKMFDELLEE